MIKYKAIFSYKPSIIKVEVVKETTASVWRKTGTTDKEVAQERKETTCSKYFDDFESAKKYLIEFYGNSVEVKRIQLEEAKDRWREAGDLTEQN